MSTGNSRKKNFNTQNTLPRLRSIWRPGHSVRSRMSRMKHFTGGPEHCSWDARFVVLSSLRPRVCQGCQQSELMLSYWWMIISTNDFTSKAHRWNSDAIFEYYYHLQPLESLGHLANVTMEKDVKKGLTPLIYNLL